MQNTRSTKNKKNENDTNKIRIEKESYHEHPPAKGMHKQKKPYKKKKVAKSHVAIQ